MDEPQSGRSALLAGGLAAIFASTCWLGPLVLVAMFVAWRCLYQSATANAGYPSTRKN